VRLELAGERNGDAWSRGGEAVGEWWEGLGWVLDFDKQD
jgi:hypothetical protein